MTGGLRKRETSLSEADAITDVMQAERALLRCYAEIFACPLDKSDREVLTMLFYDAADGAGEACDMFSATRSDDLPADEEGRKSMRAALAARKKQVLSGIEKEEDPS